jgi:hypothetical protein
MNSYITDVPDYAALKKLAAALWQENNSYYGAAVMVGAGFSRVAASTGDIKRKLPLWNELSDVLAKDIGSSNQTDPLRQAEEYRAYFGQQALLDLLKKAVSDTAWSPGALHKNLLELPWSEVLTTNWDTLLERASVDVHKPTYNVVNRQEDLASARTPRIVKLHGTIGITDELIFTQEDFRKYPQRHAAFVNFARQVFIENELCLLGFSGDDPNFLQWAGWVRDHLATHARRIYLVGALNLTAAKRKYLESINVAPIDLSPLVADYDEPDAKHAEATKVFIEALQKLKPKQAWEWVPAQLRRHTLSSEEITRTHRDAAYAAKLLEEQIKTLELDRAAYPGWLTCPPSLLFRLQHQLSDPWPTSQSLSAMTPDSRAKLLYEISWRCDVTYQAIPSWLTQELLTICDPAYPSTLTKRQQMEIALLLLKSTRWLDKYEAQSIEQATTAMLERDTKHWPDVINELAYHRAIVARDQFDYPVIESAIERIVPNTPVWKLKKGCLLAELCRFDEGKGLVAEAYRDLLDQNRKDRNSIHVLSRLAWAHWLMHGIDLWASGNEFKAFPASYQDLKCSPWSHIEHIRNRVSKALEKQREYQSIEPLFEPGSYKDNSKTITFNSELHPLLLVDGISQTVGMPLRWSGVSFLVEPAAELSGLVDIDDVHRFALAIRTANSDSSNVLKMTFSRTRVACFSSEDVNCLMDRCKSAIGYWGARLTGDTSNTRIHVVERLRVFIEVLARISVRATPEQAKEFFRLALAIAKKPEAHHHWLADALRHLSDYALECVPDDQQPELLGEALSFPLQTEINVGAHSEWLNPVVRYPGERRSNAALDRRIDEIIDGIAPCSPHSAPALLRLLPLLDVGFLTVAECGKIGEKVWGLAPDYQSLPQTGLFTYVLLKFPAPDNSAVRNAVRRYLFEARGDHSFGSTLLRDIVEAARAKGVEELPSAEQAEAYFEKLVAWRDEKVSEDAFRLFDQEDQNGNLIGQVLAYAIAPALPVEALNQDNFDKLLAFHAEVDASAAIIALSRFAAANELFAGKVEKCIRQGLQGRDANKVASSAFALLKWREMESSPATGRLTSRLVYLLGSSLGGGLPTLLWTAGQMYAKGYFSDDDTESLIDSVPMVFDSADYKNISSFSRESVSISLVRAECARLARAILSTRQDANNELIRVLQEAKQDALPEVRFSEATDDSKSHGQTKTRT